MPNFFRKSNLRAPLIPLEDDCSELCPIHLLIPPAARALHHCQCQFLGRQPHSFAGSRPRQPRTFFQEHQPLEEEYIPWLQRKAFVESPKSCFKS